jgi:6-phosphofructokinase 1
MHRPSDQNFDALTPELLRTKSLGPRTVPSPLTHGGLAGGFVPDGAAIPLDVEIVPGKPRRDDLSFAKAGPRETIYFDPQTVRAAIATCGGLCPGLNNVIRSICIQLRYGYGVRNEVLGIPYGYLGMNPASGLLPVPLTAERVADIHKHGGTILGSSREKVDPDVAVSFLQRLGIQILFAIGGDGTLKGAHLIHQAAERRGYKLAVVGIPKTIDNDIPFVWRSFGYFTALEKAREVIDYAHNEAKGHFNGVGLVRLMGRSAGFIAAGATLASGEVNFTLIPEVPFKLDGAKGFLSCLRQRLDARHHAVIVVAEGAGQELIPDEPRYNAPGQAGFKNVGLFLLDEIKRDCKAHGLPVDIKYFDPAYQIRSAAANSEDSLLCDQLARHAVHAGMAGMTDTVIGLWYNISTYVPIELVVGRHKRISQTNEIWRTVLHVTGQPARFADESP